MSARDEIANSLWYGLPSTCDEHAQELAEGMMEAYAAEVRAETLREAADKLSEDMGPREMEYESERVARIVDGYYIAVDSLRRMAGESE